MESTGQTVAIVLTAAALVAAVSYLAGLQIVIQAVSLIDRARAARRKAEG